MKKLLVLASLALICMSLNYTKNGVGLNVSVQNPAPCNSCTGRIICISSGGSGYYSWSKYSGRTFQGSNVFLQLCSGYYYIQTIDNTGQRSPIAKTRVGCLQ